MAVSRTLPLVFLIPLAACGASETPEAPPGSVERLTTQLDRNEAAERRATARRIDREAEARTERFEQRIEAIEKKQAGGS